VFLSKVFSLTKIRTAERGAAFPVPCPQRRTVPSGFPVFASSFLTARIHVNSALLYSTRDWRKASDFARRLSRSLIVIDRCFRQPHARMFKKFKDKLAEEMKQSPARLQASVQQLAQVKLSLLVRTWLNVILRKWRSAIDFFFCCYFLQAVVSPALSNSSIQEVSASNDNFSLTEDGDGKHTLIALASFIIGCTKLKIFDIWTKWLEWVNGMLMTLQLWRHEESWKDLYLSILFRESIM